MTQLTGLYPGTFDPITLGHIDILRRAVKLVDRLIVGVAVNTGKDPMFTLDERAALVREALEGIDADARAQVTVMPFEGLLMHFAEANGVDVIVRGLRAVSDFEYEFQMVGMNSFLNEEIETVFLMADARYQAIASRLVKEIARLGGDVSAFVPPVVEKRLLEKARG
ncbi:pantetheine-phosphate adenylyltransferase [Parvularcula dongshanensis]|uniref:Phosphopantetheine adenylyltransferase n=1 Tax=Parvularcula dongshanensis TaxID=1173995 RepID=A0A840I159_9PROT|nr:pantetheine-phosphate adenylyltransferase [Parvularcula dongshanensis]MBB4658477.1 pantetheine-phosphate adenylyltransferase [Parvularcula dongshanensis]